MSEDPAAFDAVRVHAAAAVVACRARRDAVYEDFVAFFEAGDAGAGFVDSAKWSDGVAILVLRSRRSGVGLLAGV